MAKLTIAQILQAVEALQLQTEALRALLVDCKQPSTYRDPIARLDHAAMHIERAASALALLIK